MIFLDNSRGDFGYQDVGGERLKSLGTYLPLCRDTHLALGATAIIAEPRTACLRPGQRQQ
jgi:hypothetical protein